MDHRLPLLGVCYGHQLMAYALGGEVGDNPRGWERGLQTVCLSAASDALPSALPPSFSAWLSHRQSVLTPPAGSQVLAGSALDPCQIIRYSERALSVQFHPEFTADIMQACLRNRFTAAEQSQMIPAGEVAHWPLALLRQFWQQAQQPQTTVNSVAS